VTFYDEHGRELDPATYDGVPPWFHTATGCRLGVISNEWARAAWHEARGEVDPAKVTAAQILARHK
jgi:hypothetical protein